MTNGSLCYDASHMPPGRLSIVATPIGNLEDLSPRARRILTECSVILCEDTRVTAKLLRAYGITTPARSIHEHSTKHRIAEEIAELERGKHAAYVCDAGTPGMNDPGGKLVAAAYEAHIPLETIPGPSALTAMIAVCGFPMDDFHYVGFIPHKKGRQTLFKQISETTAPTIFLESTHRIEKTLDALAEILSPTRIICLGRELTKMHETLYRGTVADVQAALKTTSHKGEFIGVVGPANFTLSSRL